MEDYLQQAIRDLRLTMGKMEIALGLIDEAIVWINDVGSIEWCNGVFDRMVSKQHIELIGKSITDMLLLEELGTGEQIVHPAMLVLERNDALRAFYQTASDRVPVELIAMPLAFPQQPPGAIITIRDVTDLQELEQVRLQSLALQAAVDAIAITDPTGKIEWVNRAFNELTGYQTEELYGQNMKLLQSGKTPANIYVEMWDAIKKGKVWSGELVNKRADGSLYYEEQTITPVCNRSDILQNFIAIKRDITRRKETEQMLIDSEAGLRQLYEITSTPDQILSGKLRKLLHLGCRRLGLAYGMITRLSDGALEVVARHDFSRPLTREGVAELTETYCLKTIQTEELTGTLSEAELSGKEHALKIKAHLGIRHTIDDLEFGALDFFDTKAKTSEFSSGELAFLRLMGQWIGNEFSDQKKNEEIRKLSSVATRTDNAVIITNATGEIEWVNAAFTKMTEYPLNEVIGLRPGDLMQGPESDPQTISLMSQCIKNKEGFDVEIVNYTKSGRKIWLSIEVRPLYDEEQNVINFLSIENDITERKQSEQKMAALRNREISIASRIQRTLLLGQNQERICGVEVAAMSIPSQHVDGDFFDCFIHSDDCMDIVVGDVMGKGVPAALLGAAAKNAILRSMSSIISSSRDHHLPSPREIIMSLHAGLTKELIELESFVTLFYARLHGKKKTMRFVDCGHTRSIRCGRDDPSGSFFSGENLPLGLMAREIYKESEVELQDGDVILIYSDGITEANSPEGEMLGDERLLRVVSSNRQLDSKEILEKIYATTKDFTTTETFDDDLTCLVLKIDEDWKSPLLGIKSFTYAAALENLATLRKDLKEFICQHYDVNHDEDVLNQSLVGVNEAATNIIQHAFPDDESEALIKMTLAGRPAQIEIELCHNGAAFTGIATIRPVPEGHTDSGYGLYIMEQSMDAIHYSRQEDGMNRIVMIKNVKQGEAAQE